MVPCELREWLEFTNGPRIGPGGVFGIRPYDEWYDIEYYYTPALYPEWLTKGWIPIASDGCGDYYVIATHPDWGPGSPVLFLDKAKELLAPEYLVASDLWHFLRFYLAKELGERGWPFTRDMVLSVDPGLAGRPTSILPWGQEVRDAGVKGRRGQT